MNWEIMFFSICFYLMITTSCFSLNNDGKVLLKFRDSVFDDPYGAFKDWNHQSDYCSWFGVQCDDHRRVVSLNLKDLCLSGKLPPDFRNLVHIKSIILRNNSFSGVIPEGIGELKELEVLDLGCNNFSRPVPHDLGSNHSLSVFLLDNNPLIGNLSPEIDHQKLIFESQVDENQLSSAVNRRSITWEVLQNGNAVNKRQLQEIGSPPQGQSQSPAPTRSPFYNPYGSIVKPAPAPGAEQPKITRSSPRTLTLESVPEPLPAPAPNDTTTSVNGSSLPPPTLTSPEHSHTKTHVVPIIAGTVGGFLFLIVSIFGIYFCKFHKAPIRPWATGLSCQLQKAFVTGIFLLLVETISNCS